MAGKVINLRAARKSKTRDQAADKAAENRIKFGRTKGEKTRGERQSEKSDRLLDGHLIERPEED